VTGEGCLIGEAKISGLDFLLGSLVHVRLPPFATGASKVISHAQVNQAVSNPCCHSARSFGFGIAGLAECVCLKADRSPAAQV
jgi:hypothetical protein